MFARNELDIWYDQGSIIRFKIRLSINVISVQMNLGKLVFRCASISRRALCPLLTAMTHSLTHSWFLILSHLCLKIFIKSGTSFWLTDLCSQPTPSSFRSSVTPSEVSRANYEQLINHQWFNIMPSMICSWTCWAAAAVIGSSWKTSPYCANHARQQGASRWWRRCHRRGPIFCHRGLICQRWPIGPICHRQHCQ